MRTFTERDDYDFQYSGPESEQTQQIVQNNWSSIRTSATRRQRTKIYNVTIYNNDIASALRSENIASIFEEQPVKFKVNASIGCVLMHNTTKRMRFFHPSANMDRLFPSPKLIERKDDFDAFIQNVLDLDLVESSLRSRPDTSWTCHAVTNISFFLYAIQDHVIGSPSEDISSYIKNSKAMRALTCDKSGKPYTDKKCFFRCLALMKGEEEYLEESATNYLQQYLTATKRKGKFNGISLSDLSTIERLFKVSITVYSLIQKNCDTLGRLIRRPCSLYSRQLYLNLNKNHFSWIKDLRMYAHSYSCPYCDKLEKTAYALKRHMTSCSPGSNLSYPGGIYKVPDGIIDKLRGIGVGINESLKYNPYLACFDCESWLDQSDKPKNSPTIQWIGKHRLASISVATNVSGFTKPVCWVSEGNDEHLLVSNMMDYLISVSEVCYERLRHRYRNVFSQLLDKKERALEAERSAYNGIGVEKLTAYFDSLESELEAFLRQLICFGFNSGKYDLPLIKSHLVKYLLENDIDITFTAKKGSSYLCIATECVRFLDVTNFVAPGFSLSDYLKAYNAEDKKFCWVHDRFTSLDILRETEFPQHEDFYSNLKDSNITKEEYENCKRVWDECGMKSLKDMLIYYNNADCVGLVQALETHSSFLRTKGLHFTNALSVPGLAIKLLQDLKTPEHDIHLIGERNKDLYHLIRNNIRGGPSIVFNRYQKANITKVKPEYFGKEAKTTETVLGVDCSALYLSCLVKDMPTGIPIRRREINDFVAEKDGSYSYEAIQWISWMEKKLGIEFQHKLRKGEKRIGGRQIPVDGYGVNENGEKIILQFSGCYYHSHKCSLAPRGRFSDGKKDTENLLKTIGNLVYFQQLGYTVFHTFECEFLRLKSDDSAMRQFCNDLDILPDERYRITSQQILDEIADGSMFGMALVDIEVPEAMRVYFSEFQPIFKHAFLDRENIGSHMKAFAEANGLMKKPTKTLIGSFWAKSILLTSPLLRWYMAHGLVITRLYEVVQYRPVKCFKKFGDEVVTSRRSGDSDSKLKIVSDSMKLIGMMISSKSQNSSLS